MTEERFEALDSQIRKAKTWFIAACCGEMVVICYAAYFAWRGS